MNSGSRAPARPPQEPRRTLQMPWSKENSGKGTSAAAAADVRVLYEGVRRRRPQHGTLPRNMLQVMSSCRTHRILTC
jgi:hypothetical protein